MNTTTITIEHLRDWSACYIDSDEPAHRELLSRLGGGVDLVALLRCPDVPVEDRIWVACRALDARTARLFACRCARRALERERAAKREPDPRSWGAVDVAERFARNEASAEELRAAWAAARAAERQAQIDDIVALLEVVS